jgi:hypothetical protein
MGPPLEENMMNRSHEVRMACEAAGIHDGQIYISGPNADCNVTGDIEYNVRFDTGTLAQRLLACEYARRFIGGCVGAELTRSYKSSGRQLGQRIRIRFRDRSDGSSLDSVTPTMLANRARRARACAAVFGT